HPDLVDGSQAPRDPGGGGVRPADAHPPHRPRRHADRLVRRHPRREGAGIMKRVLLMTMIVLQAAGLHAFAGEPVSRSSTERFHVAVLAASRKEGPVPSVTAGEAKALADFQKVMTYKSFIVEAETLLQSDRSAEARLGAYNVMLQIDSIRKNEDTIDV